MKKALQNTTQNNSRSLIEVKNGVPDTISMWLEAYFQFEVTMPVELDASLVGQRVYVKIQHGYETFAMQWYRSFKELFLNELGKI